MISKFLIVGALNTFVGYTIYATLLALNFAYLVALFIASIAGVAFNYFSTSRLVFNTKGKATVFYKFIFAYVLSYFFNAAGLELLIKYLDINPYLGQAIFVPLNVLLSWLLMNYWVYKNEEYDVKKNN